MSLSDLSDIPQKKDFEVCELHLIFEIELTQSLVSPEKLQQLLVQDEDMAALHLAHLLWLYL